MALVTGIIRLLYGRGEVLRLQSLWDNRKFCYKKGLSLLKTVL